MTREATILRETAETRIEVTVNLDGAGRADVASGIGFFDHMLCAFARHGRFDLKVSVRGDLHVDGHHTVEDTGIVLGRALATQLAREFFIALAANAGITLHIRQLAGDNVHHIFEAAFKAAGRALRQAVAVDPALGGEVPSTKGVL